MATDTTDPTSKDSPSEEALDEFRANPSWLYDTPAGELLRFVAIALTTVVIGIFVLFPLYWMVVTALKTTSEIQQIPPTVFPTDPSIEGFRLVIESSLAASFLGDYAESWFGWEVSSAIEIGRAHV